MLAGCNSDSSTGNASGALTSGEAYALASEFFTLLQQIDIGIFTSTAVPPASPAAVPYGDLYDDQIDINQPCDAGGNATVVGSITGDVDPQTNDADLNATATADFAGCGIVGETSTITVNGNPDVGITAHILSSQQAASVDLAAQGSVSYATDDGRDGTCGVDLSASVNFSALGLSQSLTGTMCGIDASGFDLQLITP